MADAVDCNRNCRCSRRGRDNVSAEKVDSFIVDRVPTSGCDINTASPVGLNRCIECVEASEVSSVFQLVCDEVQITVGRRPARSVFEDNAQASFNQEEGIACMRDGSTDGNRTA